MSTGHVKSAYFNTHSCFDAMSCAVTGAFSVYLAFLGVVRPSFLRKASTCLVS